MKDGRSVRVEVEANRSGTRRYATNVALRKLIIVGNLMADQLECEHIGHQEAPIWEAWEHYLKRFQEGSK